MSDQEERQPLSQETVTRLNGTVKSSGEEMEEKEEKEEKKEKEEREERRGRRGKVESEVRISER